MCTRLRHNGSLAHPFPRRFAAHQRVGVVGQSRNFAADQELNAENSETTTRRRMAIMGVAQYAVTPQGQGWTVLHDGNAKSDYATKEAAFEAAVAAASLAIREGHAIDIKVSSRPM
jgi:hypothetical protein